MDTKYRVTMETVTLPPVLRAVSEPMVPHASSPSSTMGNNSTSAPLKETIQLGAQPKQMQMGIMSRATMLTVLPAVLLETNANGLNSN